MPLVERITRPTVEVLRVLLATDEPIWGLRVVKATGLKAGSVYPILSRLEDGSWITGEWESAGDRPGARRRLYRLTGEGRVEALKVVAAYESKAREDQIVVLPPGAREGFA